MPKSTCALSLPNHYLAAGLGVHLQVRGDCGDGVLDLEEVALHLGRVRVRARARVRVRDKVRVRVRVSMARLSTAAVLCGATRLGSIT